MTNALEVAVAKRIGEFDLDVTFSLKSGMLVLFGPSGAGKSLTLSLIAGLIRPDTGTIRIDGTLVTDNGHRIHVSPQGRRIGIVFQEGLLLPHRSVLDNVALAVRQSKGRAGRRAVAQSWLERVGAGDLARRRPGSLSGGQRQRAALARGLAGDPALMLLDEPLSSLDLTARTELRELIRDVVTSSGIPTVLVTHDAAEAEELADLMVMYNGGKVTGIRTIERSSRPEILREMPSGTETV